MHSVSLYKNNQATENKRNVFLAFSVLIFVLSPIYSLQDTANPGALYVLSIIISTFFYCSIHHKIRLYSYHYIAILMWCFGIISNLLGPFGVFDFGIFKYLSFVIYFICISSIRFTSKDLKFIAKYYIYTAIIISILIILSYIFGYAYSDAYSSMGRYSIDITGIDKNPNYLTSFVNIALYVIWYSVWGKGNQRIKCIVVICIFVPSIYFTGTRAALILAIFVITIVFLNHIKYNGKIFLTLLVLFVAFLSVLFLKDYFVDMMDYYLGQRNMLEDVGRTDSWLIAYQKILEYPMFGCGLFAWDTIGKSAPLDYLHNVFLELILNQGVIGLILFACMFLGGITKIKKEDKFFIYIFIIVTAFPLLFQNGVIAVNFWRFIILNRIVINYSIYSKDGIATLCHK